MDIVKKIILGLLIGVLIVMIAITINIKKQEEEKMIIEAVHKEVEMKMNKRIIKIEKNLINET